MLSCDRGLPLDLNGERRETGSAPDSDDNRPGDEETEMHLTRVGKREKTIFLKSKAVTGVGINASVISSSGKLRLRRICDYGCAGRKLVLFDWNRGPHRAVN